MRVFASFDTSAAKNTFGSISLDGRSEDIDGDGRFFALIHIVARADELSDVKEFALTVLVALLTIFIVVGKKKFNGTSSRFHRLGRGNGYFHSFVDGVNARSDKSSRAGCLYKADSARASGTFAVIESAKRGNLVTAGFRRFEYGHTGFDFVRYAFDFNIYFSHSLSSSAYFFSTAPNLHDAIHIPHLIHFFVSITYGSFPTTP